jgi:hypothetical protein
MRRMGRPGLVGTMARTAVVAGTAGAVHHRQQRRYAEQDQDAYAQQQQAEEAAAYREMQAQQVAAPPAAAAPAVDVTGELQKLAELKASGVLTDEEFAAAKAKLLG